MPLPVPNNKEKKSDFVSRCVSEVAKDPKFKDNKQRVAICYTQFEEAKKSKASVVAGYDDEEFLIFASCDEEHSMDDDESMEDEDSMEEDDAAQKTYQGKKRSELKDSDFLFPDKRSFPIVSPQDVRDAISNFGRMGGDMTYDQFIKKLYQKAKSKGQDFVNAIPEKTRKEHNLQ